MRITKDLPFTLIMLCLLAGLFTACQPSTAPAAAPEEEAPTDDPLATEKVLQERMDEIFDLAESNYVQASAEMADATDFPRNALPDGSWNMRPMDDWTGGFFPGVLWQIYAYTGSDEARAAAHLWTEKNRENRYFDANHDIGFIMMSSFGNALRLTKDSTTYLEPLLTAAKTGAGRFNENTGVIRSWGTKDGNGVTIIDNMMNLRVYTHADDVTGNGDYTDMVRSHSDVTLKNHFRADGSSFHVLDYDMTTGEVARKYTAQGYADDSAWSRGQAWGIYGYLETYESLGDQRYLDQAIKSADYFISRLPTDDPVPYWDFDTPNIPREERDASAGAIAASAFIRLSEVTNDLTYRQVAVRLLTSLSSPKHLTPKGVKMQGLLPHAVGSKPAGLERGEIDMHLVYGDYYFLEALNRL